MYPGQPTHRAVQPVPADCPRRDRWQAKRFNHGNFPESQKYSESVREPQTIIRIVSSLVLVYSIVMDENVGETILVVDDMLENTTLLARILTSSGYQVQVANNGMDAIRYAQTSPPDLILLDISMPAMDGFETCRRLKQDQRTGDIPVIFISAFGDIDNKVKAFQEGGVDWDCRRRITFFPA